MAYHTFDVFCRRGWRCLLMLPSIAFADGESSSPPASTPVSALPSAPIVISGGFDYSRGDYGLATDTDVFTVPLNHPPCHQRRRSAPATCVSTQTSGKHDRP